MPSDSDDSDEQPTIASDHSAGTPGQGEDTPSSNDRPTRPDVADVPEFLDWILGGLVVLGGLLSTSIGAVIFVAPDRETIEAVVADEDFEVEGMTEPEAVELALALLTWIGAGFLLMGVVGVVLGVAYVVHRRRVHDRAAAGEPTSDFIAHALLGAVVSAVTSFIPFSPVIGGGVAGYLERGDSERTLRVGTASAVIFAAPIVALALFVAGGVIAGFARIGDSSLGVVAALMIVIVAAFSLAFTALFGAIGGWIGGKLAEYVGK